MKIEEIIKSLVVKKYQVMFAICFLIIGFGYLILIKPELENYKVSVNKERLLKRDFSIKYNSVLKLNSHRNQLDSLNRTFKKIVESPDSQYEMSRLTEKMFNLGKRLGLFVKFFSPKAEIRQEYYFESAIKMSVIGDYNHLAQFLSGIAKLQRFITFENFKITRSRRDSHATDLTNLLLMKITIKIYRLR